ncbi:MAG: twin-arginine translocation signal domain-containing protein [Sedimentisphaerales bacterium]
MDRRGFLRLAASAGVGLALSPRVFGGTTGGTKPDDINVALLGAGAQGYRLMELICLRQIPGIRIKAVCDIWTE